MIVLDFPYGMILWAIFSDLSFIALTAMPFFKTDPLIWNGIISFWTLFGTYFIGPAQWAFASRRMRAGRLRHESEPDVRILAFTGDFVIVHGPGERLMPAPILRIRRMLSGREISR